MKIVVAGASGFVGAQLSALLGAAGHQVVALARHPDGAVQTEGVEERAVDVSHYDQVQEVLQGAQAAYYLIHSMGGEGFERKDLELARKFAGAAASAGVKRIIYQGALGSGDLSPHLVSRQRVGRVLGSAGVPVVELRAAVILGSGSISFDLMRYLTERLPAMTCPRWVDTRIEPIAISDALACLVKALEVPPGIYEIGCGEVSSYREMMQLYARVRGLHRRRIVVLPFLSLNLASRWIDLVTPLDRKVTHTLMDSLGCSVVVEDPARAGTAFGIVPLGIEASMRKALQDQAEYLPQTLFDGFEGLRENVYHVNLQEQVEPQAATAIRADLAKIGGDLAWYGWPWVWRLRFVLGLLFGERNPIGRPKSLAVGEAADWWTIALTTGDSLVLRSHAWSTGEGWLGYSIPPGGSRLQVAAAFCPKGLPGFLYWFVLTSVHKRVFRAMVKVRIARARVVAGDGSRP